jgi:DNA-binding MarR family transcriptional regulator
MNPISQEDLRNLARFRHAVRRLLHASEEAAREAGLTPHQHQLLLGVAGFTGTGHATIGELAEFLQLRHHSVVGLVDRAEALKLLRRRPNPKDRRQVYVSLTAAGARKLQQLAAPHRKELNGMRRSLDILDVEPERAAKRAARAAAPKRGARH